MERDDSYNQDVDSAEQTWAYAGENQDEDEEGVTDLGFIIDDREDRRSEFVTDWSGSDAVDPAGGLDPDRAAQMPPASPTSAFVSDFHIGNAAREAEEEEWVRDQMPDPDDAYNTADYRGSTQPVPPRLQDDTPMGRHEELTADITGVAEAADPDEFGAQTTASLDAMGFQVHEAAVDPALAQANRDGLDETDGPIDALGGTLGPDDYIEPNADQKALEGRGDAVR